MHQLQIHAVANDIAHAFVNDLFVCDQFFKSPLFGFSYPLFELIELRLVLSLLDVIEVVVEALYCLLLFNCLLVFVMKLTFQLGNDHKSTAS